MKSKKLAVPGAQPAVETVYLQQFQDQRGKTFYVGCFEGKMLVVAPTTSSERPYKTTAAMKLVIGHIPGKLR